MVKAENITIIGSGPAGYTAAIYAARAGLSPLMISGLEQGGQLMITTDVENYPGFEKPVQGPWLMEQMKNQAKSFGTRILVDLVKDVDLNSLPFKIKTEKEVEFIRDSNVTEITGDLEKKVLQSNTIKNKKNEINQLSVDGFFVAIGHSPATTLFKNKLQMDNDGYIFTEPNSTKTDIDGVFAAGDVTDRLYRQAVTAAGMGCMSAIEAESFLSSKKII